MLKQTVIQSSDYVGHGIGRHMHGSQIPNYGKPGLGPKIKAGYVFAVEPMVNKGTHYTKFCQTGGGCHNGQATSALTHDCNYRRGEVLARVPLGHSTAYSVVCN
jgi:hypothetical protein